MFDFIAIPFGWVLRIIFMVVGSYGLSIVIFTIFTKALMYPLMLKSKKSMRKMQKLKPLQDEVTKKYANNKQKQQEEMAKLYSEHGVNPLGSCLPTLATMPIMLGLYYVIQQPLSYLMGISEEAIGKIADTLGMPIATTLQQSEIAIANAVYNSFDTVSHISDKLIAIDFNFLGFNLAQTPSLTEISILTLVPIISTITSFASMMINQKLQGTSMDGQPGMMKAMMYLMPFMSGYFGTILPAGVSLYWIMGNILMVVQELVMSAHLKGHESKAEEIALAIKTREDENRRREIEIKKEEQRLISAKSQEKAHEYKNKSVNKNKKKK